jgi:hypothetical protein
MSWDSTAGSSPARDIEFSIESPSREDSMDRCLELLTSLREYGFIGIPFKRGALLQFSFRRQVVAELEYSSYLDWKLRCGFSIDIVDEQTTVDSDNTELTSSVVNNLVTTFAVLN